MTGEAGYNSVFKDGLFKGRRIIVTGGGSGIGRCTAHELAALGAEVIITGRTQARLDGVQAEITEDGGTCTTSAFDIREEEAVKAAIAGILKDGPVHGLVNNAGGQYPSPLEAISTKGFETVLRTNVVGAFNMTRELVTQSMNKTGGAVVNITADFHNGMPTMGHSGAARAACDNFTKTAAVEWGRFGVRVNSVAPGWVASSGFDSYDDPGVKAMLPQLKNLVPLGRIATEAEIASAIVFLLSDGAAFISGATLRVDGAASLFSPLFPPQGAKYSESYQGFHRYVPPSALRGDD
ncbi:SDR family oxidoreductase [Kordiimonas lacus]|uniref:Peroxisomal trans-2-enoyl-CoA reductase n=1 Tax=Kordiimonas lacus TaxID=637679 RepID=A0A1G7BFX6_9PROT|nr:SDR family oxidoreductase [Kordiimonas lacus]SDE25872.1 citronellol/citronellal dehydrogenase [Kordiimonas lacus]